MRDFYFTLSTSHAQDHFNSSRGGYVKITAQSAVDAADWMYKLYGQRWSFQYDRVEDIHELDRHMFAAHEFPTTCPKGGSNDGKTDAG